MDAKEWNNRAKNMIKAELSKKGVDYIELAKRLNDLGIKESQMNIANKINRGTFNFTFALQVFKALGLKKLNLEDL
jgi:hypothetical protein